MTIKWRRLRRVSRHWISVAFLKFVLFIGRFLPYRLRIRFGALILSKLAAIPSHARMPIIEHSRIVFPAWDDQKRRAFMHQNIRHFSQNLMELYNIEGFSKRQARFHVSGEGYAVLMAQKEKRFGAVIVSGHLGHWEAIRAHWQAQGIPLGAIYKKAHNPYYEEMFAKALQFNGPAVHTGVRGMAQLVRILKSGGFISLLHDQKLEGAPLLPFLGQDVHTSLAAAELALKYDVPLIPAYAIRREDHYNYDLIFETAIPASDAKTMTLAMNASLEKKIKEFPCQWLWLYDRWTVFSDEQAEP